MAVGEDTEVWIDIAVVQGTDEGRGEEGGGDKRGLRISGREESEYKLSSSSDWMKKSTLIRIGFCHRCDQA